MSEPTRLLRLDADVVEKVVLLPAYALFAANMIDAYLATGRVASLLYLGDQAVVVGFILFRRSTTDISRRPSDWALGLAGTFLPLLVQGSDAPPLVAPELAAALILAGFAVHVLAKLTLRRSFGVIAANRGVKASGPYRLIRHPMYAGYMLSQTGIFLAEPSLFNLGLIVLLWALQVGRILAEERVLGGDDAYRALMTSTRYRLVPGVF